MSCSALSRQYHSYYVPIFLVSTSQIAILTVILCAGSSVLVAFEPNVILEHEAVIGGFKCLYHLVKKEQAHHTNYSDLLDLAELLGCDYFKKLKVTYFGLYQSTYTIGKLYW